MLTSPGEKTPIALQDGVGRLFLHVHRTHAVFVRNWKPGSAVGESGEPALRAPRNRCPATIAALEFRPERDAERILQQLEGNVGLGQSEFFTLIDTDAAAHAAQHGD